MTVIRIENRLLREVQEKLKINGMFGPGMSFAASIKAALSDWLYQTPNLQDGREQALEILAKAGKVPSWHLKGQVAKFGEHYAWEGGEDSASSCALPPELSSALEKSFAEAEQNLELEIHPPKIDPAPDKLPSDLPSFLGGSEQPLPTFPPWHELKQTHIDDIYKAYPKHRIWVLKSGELICEDETYRIAVQVAFANTPGMVHTTPRMLEIIDQLYEEYKTYEERKKDNE